MRRRLGLRLLGGNAQPALVDAQVAQLLHEQARAEHVRGGHDDLAAGLPRCFVACPRLRVRRPARHEDDDALARVGAAGARLRPGRLGGAERGGGDGGDLRVRVVEGRLGVGEEGLVKRVADVFVEERFEDWGEAGEGVFFLSGGGSLLFARKEGLEGGSVFERFGDAGAEELEVVDDFTVARGEIGVGEKLLEIRG